MSKLRLRRATKEDANLLYEWRNDEATRRYSFNQDKVTFSSHLDWFTDSLANPDRCILIAENDTLPIGVFRFDKIESSLEVSIYLDPALHGQGYGTRILETGIEYVKAHYPEITKLSGKILAGNVASKKAFLKAGFFEEYVTMEYKLK